jgi:hypothetical protein
MARSTVVLLDEYLGLPAGDPIRCDSQLRRQLIDRLDRHPARFLAFDVDDGEVITTVSDNWNGSARVVKSIGSQWAVGSEASINHSTFSNNDRAVTVAPGIEYDFFPYRDWSRKSLTVRYTAGASIRRNAMSVCATAKTSLRRTLRARARISRSGIPVAQAAAISAPMLEPMTRSGARLRSCNACSTPRWASPLRPPPLSTRVNERSGMSRPACKLHASAALPAS